MPDVNQEVTVTGNENTTITVAGDLVVNPVRSPRPGRRERGRLLDLLRRVRQAWITDVLEQSDLHAALFELDIRSEPDAVDHPARPFLQAFGVPPREVTAELTVQREFEAAGRFLLILGDAGAGKTTALLRLARECLDRSARDPDVPFPVVLHLSTWNSAAASFREWLVRELGVRYYIGADRVKTWLKEHRLMLFLDGLDEIAENRRAEFVRALHSYMEHDGVPGLAICCRSEEYLRLPAPLKLGGAVSILPLTHEEIAGYVGRTDPSLDGLRAALARTPELLELARSPLMLNVMATALRGVPADALDFDDTATGEVLRTEILERYVGRMFVRRRRADEPFGREQTELFLEWLAREMSRRGETIFAVELLQPTWLSRRQLKLYAPVSRVVGATWLGTVVGLGVNFFVAFGSPAGPSREAAMQIATPYLIGSVLLGAITGMIYAPIDYLRLRNRGGVTGEVARRPLPITNLLRRAIVFIGPYLLLAVALVVFLQWFPEGHYPQEWRGALFCIPLLYLNFDREQKRDITLGGRREWRQRGALVGALAAGLFVALLADLASLPREAALAGTSGAVMLGALYGGWREAAQVRAQAILRWSGIATVAVFTLVVGLSTWSPTGWRSFWTSAIVLGAVLLSGLLWDSRVGLLRHAVLRSTLAVTGPVPLRIRHILAYAVHLGFLQRSQGDYLFIHQQVQEHFATRAATRASPRPDA